MDSSNFPMHDGILGSFKLTFPVQIQELFKGGRLKMGKNFDLAVLKVYKC